MKFAKHYRGAPNDKISKSTAARMAGVMQRWACRWHERSLACIGNGDIAGAVRFQNMAAKDYADARFYMGAD